MGCITSKLSGPYTTNSGTEADYLQRFTDIRTLGQGEFGIVKLVSDNNNNSSDDGDKQFACKILNKGFTFKDNVLYPPMDAKYLKMEMDILTALNGQSYNLLLDSIYESPSKVYVITEVCSGGEMLEYTGTNYTDGLRTEDVSRMAFQLLSAVAHCAKLNIAHRDIKPENIMFKSNARDAELRLIDFGCATMDTAKDTTHQTFSGTPFYISPEVFQRNYTTKTDVWSVGVVLYVLVAGYPSAELQVAFDTLHKSKRELRELPGMPEDMPETYFDMLEKLLAYRYKARKSAAEMLEEDDFVLFHGEGGDDVVTTDVAVKDKISELRKRPSMKKTASMMLSGTGEKAALAFGFTTFTRALTTVLATLLSRGEIRALLANVDAHLSEEDGLDAKLGVVKVDDLMTILESMGKKDCLTAIKKQENANVYKSYNYEYTQLRALDHKTTTAAMKTGNASFRKTKDGTGSSVRNLLSGSVRKLNGKSSLANSVHIRGV